MHQELHFENIIFEYVTSINCVTFIEKNKHRFFKKIVVRINSINIKKTLLMRENIQQIIRFVLNEFFQINENDITFQLNKLKIKCITLFNMILFIIENTKIESTKIAMSIICNENQKNAFITNRIKSFYVVNTLLFSINIYLLNVVNEFVMRFKNVYTQNYDVQCFTRFEFNVLR